MIHHPFLPLKARDFSGILMFLLIILILVLIPFIWILPIYTIGHKWKFFSPIHDESMFWGLKSFWWVSVGYLIASFIALMPIPDYINAWVNWSEVTDNYTEEQNALSVLLFIIVFAFFGLAALYKINPRVLLYKHWPFGQCVGLTIAWFIGFKMVSVIYAVIGIQVFGMSFDQTGAIFSLFSATAEIKILIAQYGVWLGVLTVALLVPIYEEVIFRGVIMSACKRYLNFRWANVIQATLFALIHNDLQLFIIFFAFGMITGSLREKSGGLMSGIGFHIVNNLIAIMVIIART